MTADEIMYRGFMPEIYRQSVSPSRYYRNYLRTYVERDVRMMVNIRNLAMFEKFLRLLAGRIGQLANLSSTSTCRDSLASNVRRFIREESLAKSPTLVYDGECYPERQGVEWVNFRRIRYM